jgi:hypothetical protein
MARVVAGQGLDDAWELEIARRATSTRRKVLDDLLFGCDDRSVDAAANALATAAWNHPSARGEIFDMLMARARSGGRGSAHRPNLTDTRLRRGSRSSAVP